jgi:sucrose-6-phosphate hydrolase SacC (GH32 family)
MNVRSVLLPAVFALAFHAERASADDFPKSLVEWAPIPGNPVFQGAGDNAWDKKIRERGYILVEDGTYHLWYTGYNDTDTKSKMMSLGHATSPDGLHWLRDPANPIFTGSWTEDMCVLKRNGTYLMFAEGKDDIAHQLTSTDRIHWTDLGSLDIRKRDGSKIPPGPYGTPTVWYEDGTFYLFYERGDQGVWLATSKDRKVWTNVQEEPVLAKGPEAYDKEAVAMNQVIKRNGVYYAFYHANASRPWKDWTSCIARSRDLIHWEKYPGNPIVKDNCSSPILVSGPDGDRLYTMHPEVRAFKSAVAESPKP